MISIAVPDLPALDLHHLVMDFNGTIAEDGKLIDALIPLLNNLADSLTLHVLTADTHNTAALAVKDIPCKVHIIGSTNQDVEKQNYIKALDSRQVAAVGNGRNDTLMLKEAVLGICVIQAEGAYSQLLACSDVVCTSTADALQLLLLPKRLIATLRN